MGGSLLQVAGVVKTVAGVPLDTDKTSIPTLSQALVQEDLDMVRLHTAHSNFKSAAIFLLAIILGSLIVAMVWLGLKHATNSSSLPEGGGISEELAKRLQRQREKE